MRDLGIQEVLSLTRSLHPKENCFTSKYSHNCMSNRKTCEVPFAVVSSKSACCASQTEICNSYFFGRNFGMDAQKVHYLNKRNIRCYWFSSEYNPSFSLGARLFVKEVPPLVLVVKNVETISPWTDSPVLEKLPMANSTACQVGKLADCKPKAGTLPGINGAFQTSLSQHPTPCHSLAFARKHLMPWKSLLARHSTCLGN